MDTTGMKPGAPRAALLRFSVARCLLWLAAVVLLGGCRSDGDRQLIYREMRWLEDEIYHLEDELDNSYSRLESCRRENDALRAELNGSSRGEPRDSEVELAPPTITVPELPRIQRPSGESAPPFDSGAPSAPSDEDDVPEAYLEAPDFSRARRTRPHRGQATQVTLNRRLTGGFNADGRPGDEGVMVVVEPRDGEGELVDVAGEVSIYVTDPSLSPAERSVAQWTFTADEVAARHKKTLMATGVHFKLPWPNRPPQNSELELLVRFQPRGAKAMVAERSIRVDTNDPQHADWTTAARGSLRGLRDGANVQQRVATARPLNRRAEAGWSTSPHRPEDIDLLRRRLTSDATVQPRPREARWATTGPSEAAPSTGPIEPSTDSSATTASGDSFATPRWRPNR